jgi:hypothetical protein
MLDRDSEIKTQLMLAEQGLAAHFYAKFKNGCCYEFLQGTPLTPENMGEYGLLIAREMAHWHLAKVPSKGVPEASSLKLIHKWLKVRFFLFSFLFFSFSSVAIASSFGGVEEFTLFVRHSACGSESFGGAFD